MMRIVAALEAGTGADHDLAQLAGVFWWTVLRGRRLRKISLLRLTLRRAIARIPCES
jgi:hypothetical protein